MKVVPVIMLILLVALAGCAADGQTGPGDTSATLETATVELPTAAGTPLPVEETAASTTVETAPPTEATGAATAPATTAPAATAEATEASAEGDATPEASAQATPATLPEAGVTPTVEAVPGAVGLAPVAEGLTAPLTLVAAPDGSGRLFVVDQIGLIYVIDGQGQLLPDPFLDVQSRLVPLNSGYDERGLLGLAFHPDFAANGRLFIYYSAPLREGAPGGWNNTTVLAEYTVAGDSPNRADPASERIILQIDQPQANHEGGAVVFGPDGYLYLSLGDGGGANDTDAGHSPIGNGQDVSNLLGSILRLDVDGAQPYAIPADNPFAGGGGAPEIFAYGLRNPYRFSFDIGGNNELFVGDAGQNLYEEVSIVTAGGNYGWNIKEGTHCFNPQSPGNPPQECPDTGANGEPLIDPIIEYGHDQGLALVGGYVYRGSALPGLEGRYVFGDWSTSFGQPNGSLFVASRPASGEGLWEMQALQVANGPDGRLGHYLLGFGQDANGEIYVLASSSSGPTGTTGRVYRIVPAQ